MKFCLKIEKIQEMANNIVNIILAETEVKGMLAAPLPSNMPTRAPSATPNKVGVSADSGDLKGSKSTETSSTAKGSTGSKSISLSTNIPKVNVKPTKNPLGVYDNNTNEKV